MPNTIKELKAEILKQKEEWGNIYFDTDDLRKKI